MTRDYFPVLNDPDMQATRDLAHQYALLMGSWLKTCRSHRKHWWHASLRPSLSGLTTGVVHAASDFEMRLNLRQSLLRVETTQGKEFFEVLRGQSVTDVAVSVERFLTECGIDDCDVPQLPVEDNKVLPTGGWCAENAYAIACAINSISACLKEFRAGLREETSPIQLWPHHFDLSMIWLPGYLIEGADPADEEHADMQMNFGFTLGDSQIPEPYLYVTAYPLEGQLTRLNLPTGSVWQRDGFNGVVLKYSTLIASADPEDYLLSLWAVCQRAGLAHFEDQPGVAS